jgi:hypothetical protein
MLKPLAGDPRFVQLAGKIGGADQYRDEAESLAAATHSLLEGALVGDNL